LGKWGGPFEIVLLAMFFGINITCFRNTSPNISKFNVSIFLNSRHCTDFSGLLASDAPTAYLYHHKFGRPLTPAPTNAVFRLNHFLCLKPAPNTFCSPFQIIKSNNTIEKPEPLKETTQYVLGEATGAETTETSVNEQSKKRQRTVIKTESGKKGKSQFTDEDRINIAHWASIHQPDQAIVKQPAIQAQEALERRSHLKQLTTARPP
jgi:hypothetical protein